MPAFSRSWLLAFPLALLGVAGCPDPAGEFDDFAERWQAANPDAGAVGDAGPCTPPDPSALGGKYIFALSAVIARETPILFVADVTGDASGLTFVLQPLSAADRVTPVGTPITIGPLPLGADGSLHAELPPLVVSAEANPVTGGEIEAQVVLDGRFCDVAGFYCGTVSGTVTRPIPVDLAGSTFAIERLANGTPPAEPFIDCNRNRAAPLG
jgi:hypothetical protein